MWLIILVILLFPFQAFSGDQTSKTGVIMPADTKQLSTTFAKECCAAWPGTSVPVYDKPGGAQIGRIERMKDPEQPSIFIFYFATENAPPQKVEQHSEVSYEMSALNFYPCVIPADVGGNPGIQWIPA